MAGTGSLEGSTTERARGWHHAVHAGACDTIEPWAHGTVVRASRYPTYYNLNVVRVEDEPELSGAELAAFADQALAGLVHRRLHFELIGAAEARREELQGLGFKATKLVWMLHRRPLPAAGPEIEVEEVSYEEVDELRRRWHLEDFEEGETERYEAAAREVAETRAVRVLAVREGQRPIAFAQLEHAGGGAEITQVYVAPEHRGGGRGTAMTRAAVLAAGGAEDLWIVADAEDRPQQLYARLGFEPVWTVMEFLRLL